MPDDFSNLWPEDGTSVGGDKKKKARLAWPLMIACHSWAARAVYIYHLERGEMRVIRKPSDEQWQRFATAGVDIPYPTRIRANDLGERLKYGREQAKRLGIFKSGAE